MLEVSNHSSATRTGMPSTTKFSELRAQMSPEARAEARRLADEDLRLATGAAHEGLPQPAGELRRSEGRVKWGRRPEKA